MTRSLFFAVLAGAFVFTGCASGKFQERQEQKAQLSKEKGFVCEFVNGDVFPDLDVELSLQMASKCDGSKPFSVSPYKNSSAKNGVIYCCNLPRVTETRHADLNKREHQVKKDQEVVKKSNLEQVKPVKANALVNSGAAIVPADPVPTQNRPSAPKPPQDGN